MNGDNIERGNNAIAASQMLRYHRIQRESWTKLPVFDIFGLRVPVIQKPFHTESAVIPLSHHVLRAHHYCTF